MPSIRLRIASASLLALATVIPAAGQEPPPTAELPAEPVVTVPPQLAERELARTRRCVPLLGRVAALEEELTPLAQRGQRLQALDAAIALEDSARVAPFFADGIEQAVRGWFVADAELAERFVASGDSLLLTERRTARDQIRQRLRQEMEAVASDGQSRIAGTEDLPAASAECDDVILVRSAVLEACAALAAPNPVCQEAREPQGRYTFVDAPDDLWDVEQLRPWTEPGRLAVTPEGTLGGAQTAVLARRGNLRLVVSLEPLLRQRAGMEAEQVAEFEANLDSLGFTFEDTTHVMAPALSLHLDFTEPLGGETHYLLHFGDMADPAQDFIGSAVVPGGAPLETVFLPPAGVLARLAAGEQVSFTAVVLPETGTGEAQAVYSLLLTQVGQARSVTALLSYMAGGQLGRDLSALVAGAAGGR